MRSGVSCSAPNAIPYAQAESMAVTMVTRRNSGANNALILGLLSVPAARRSFQIRDSGTKGNRMAIGIAGSRPVHSRNRQDAGSEPLGASGNPKCGRSFMFAKI